MRRCFREITAFLDGEDSPTISNPIHSTEVAKEYGFRGPLVGGVTVYGWCVPAIIDAIGEGWLDSGWADIRFRRPVFPGDRMTAVVAVDHGDATLSMTNQDGESCVVGVLGIGRAAWAPDLVFSPSPKPEPPAAPMPELTLASAPSDVPLRSMEVLFEPAAAEAYARDLQRDPHPGWYGPNPRLHPGWLAARMTPLLKHSFWYGPSIHVRSQVQHLGAGRAGRRPVVVAGHFLRAYDDRGHHTAGLDGRIIDGDGRDVAAIRHTTIFRPRPRAPRE
jgi:hypothetical protein